MITNEARLPCKRGDATMVGYKHDTDYPAHCLVNLPDPSYCARFSDLARVPIFKLIHQQDSTCLMSNG